MKRRILSMVLTGLVTASALAESPVDKGVYAVAGEVSYNRTESSGQTLTSYSVAPSIRYYVQPRVAIGAVVAHQNAEFQRTELKSVGVGALVRYHFSDAGLSPFLQILYSFQNTDSMSKVEGVRSAAADTTTATVSIGADLFLARNVALEPTLHYTRRVLDYPEGWSADSDGTERELRLAINVSVFIY